MANRQDAALSAESPTRRKSDGGVAAVRILAVESSGRDASIAALEGVDHEARVVGERTLAGDRRTAQVLVPAVGELLGSLDWAPSDVQLAAVVAGPGSFTGLRIGVTFAKTFAYATGAEVIGVDALAVLAQQTPTGGSPFWAVLDAQRQDLFAARFECVDRAWAMRVATHIVPQDAWLARLRPGDRVSGPALRKLCHRLPAGVVAVHESFWQPRASAVGQLAWREYRSGQRDDLWALVPRYYRASAAEEKRMQRG